MMIQEDDKDLSFFRRRVHIYMHNEGVIVFEKQSRSRKPWNECKENKEKLKEAEPVNEYCSI